MASINTPSDAPATPTAPPQPTDRRNWLRSITRSYTLRVILQGIFTAWVASTFTFFLVRLLPGNPVELRVIQLTNQGYTLDEAQNMAAGMFNYDPDQPLIEQYFAYYGQLLRGDLGKSITSAGTPVIDQILRFLPWTLLSIGSAFLIAFFTGVLVGMAMAYWRGTWFDNVMTGISSVLSGMPDYVYALAIILIGGVQLGLFNVGEMRGGVDPNLDPGFTIPYIASVIKHAFLPILTYFLATVGIWTLLMKSSTITTLGEDYIHVAKARGLSEWRILTAYVGRNSMLPMVARAAINFGFVIGGSVIVERFFEYPGLGRALFTAVSTRDYTSMQGIFLLLTMAMILSNILADLLLGWLDPRVTLGEE